MLILISMIPQHYLMLLHALIFLGSPSFIRLASAANQCFGADDGGSDGIFYQAVRDYVKQDCANTKNKNCAVGQMYGWPMNSWCVGNVTDMSYLFFDMSTFNEDISGWDTSRVTDMKSIFNGATSFNGDLSAWDTSNVEDMRDMFNGERSGATSFHRDISSWNTSNVIYIRGMFFGATSFNQNLCAWGDKFPYDDADYIFMGSGCTFTGTPQKNEKGPFCASDCNGDTASPNLRSSGVVY